MLHVIYVHFPDRIVTYSESAGRLDGCSKNGSRFDKRVHDDGFLEYFNYESFYDYNEVGAIGSITHREPQGTNHGCSLQPL